MSADDPKRTGGGKMELRELPAPEAVYGFVALIPGNTAMVGAIRDSQAHPANKPMAKLDVTLRVNGVERRLALRPWTTLLDALREYLDLTGTKKGCDHSDFAELDYAFPVPTHKQPLTVH